MASMQCYTLALVFLAVLGHGFSAQQQKHELPVENNWPSLNEIRREANQIIASTFGAGSEMKANMPPPIQCNNSFSGSQCMPSLQYGYVPEFPEPIGRETVTLCSDSDCLLKALNKQSAMIYILNDIDISDVAPLPVITSHVIIMGTCGNVDRCKIDAKGKSRIFVIGLNGFLLLREVDLTAGTSKEGGAILVTGAGSNNSITGGKFVATGVEFTNNKAHGRGGALSVKSGGAAFIHNGIFNGNQATKGGAIYMGASEEFSKTDGPALCGQSSCATIVGAEFIQNFADYGGSIFVDDTNKACAKEEGARFDCRTCTFSNNSAANDGGAIFLDYDASGGAAVFRSSEFANNTAMGVGGDIATASGLPGTKGARFHAYKVLFYSGSRSVNGSSINVRPYSSGDFTYCDFHDLQEGEDKGIQCQGTCTVSCSEVHNVSARTNQGNKCTCVMEVNSVDGSNCVSCPEEPAPLCNWEPTNCHTFPINGTEAPIEAPTSSPSLAPTPAAAKPPAESAPTPSKNPVSSPSQAPGTTVLAPAPSPSSQTPVSSPPSPSPNSKTPISAPLSPSQTPVSETPTSQIPVSSPPMPSSSSPSPTAETPAPSPSPDRTLTPAPSPTLTLTPASQPAVSPAPESGLPSPQSGLPWPVPKGPKSTHRLLRA